MNHTPPSNLAQWLHFRAFNQPDRCAYAFLQQNGDIASTLTYIELENRTNAIAKELEFCAPKRERALLLFPPGLEFITAFLGCISAGVIAVPSYPPHPNRPLDHTISIIQDAEISVILTTSHLHTTLKPLFDKNLGLDHIHWITLDTLPYDQGKDRHPIEILNTDIAFLQYTSGSTNFPKGVMVSHENLMSTLRDLDTGWNHDSGSVMVNWLPTFHDLGLIYGVLVPLYKGFLSYQMAPSTFLKKPVRWLEAISRYKATHSGAPNFAYELCIRKVLPEERCSLDLSSWKMALNAAEPIREHTLTKFFETFRECGFTKKSFCPGYGLAEATVKVSSVEKNAMPVCCHLDARHLGNNKIVEASAISEKTRSFIGCGQSGIKAKILIVNPEVCKQCPQDQIGEIWVSSPSIAQGYWKHPKKTKKIFQAFLSDTKEGPYLRTGDLGFIKDNEIYITGRLKNLIIIRGTNYYPQDIELSVANSHPSLRPGCGAAFSITIKDEQCLVIVTEVKQNYLENLKTDEIIGAIRSGVIQDFDLAPHAIALLPPGGIPKTSSGKIQHRASRKAFLEERLKTAATIWVENKIKGDKSSACSFSPGSQSLKSNPADGKAIPPGQIQSWLTREISRDLLAPSQKIDTHQVFADFGIDSLKAAQLAGKLEDWLGQKISPTAFYNYPTIASLALHLGGKKESPIFTSQGLTAPNANEPIAVIGLGCRFPKASGPESFWQMLVNKTDAITTLSRDRRELGFQYTWPVDATPLEIKATQQGGFLKQVDLFDAKFFGISSSEARHMDPQQRLLLEVIWETLEHAGIAPHQLSGSKTGVFIGASTNDYARLQLDHALDELNAYTGTGMGLSIVANRISYLLNLHGPSMAVDTACSSSLVATHQACEALRAGTCDYAFAGGVNLIVSPAIALAFLRAGTLAPDGRCKTFDAEANGYGRGEGCGTVLLKRLGDAIKDNDNILALIRGSAVNHDGLSNGILAPNGISQEAVIRAALENAQVSPAHIGYVETHGTGTNLGDTIEVNALKNVLTQGRSPGDTCHFGAVKTNIGHLEAAAGIAGLIKTVLSLEHGKITPNLNFNNPNPGLCLNNTPFLLPGTQEPWGKGSSPRLAGVSSFGFGGTNAHVILEGYDDKNLKISQVTPDKSSKSRNQGLPLKDERTSHILALSAKSRPALRQIVKNYHTYITQHPESQLKDICFSANTGRGHFDHRLTIIAKTTRKAGELLKQINGKIAQGSGIGNRIKHKTIFLFPKLTPGQTGIGLELYQTQPGFRQIFENVRKLSDPVMGTKRIQDILKTGIDRKPILYIMQYALAKLWMSWGVQPDIVYGQGTGEYVAACVAGMFSFKEGLQLVIQEENLITTPKNEKSTTLIAPGITHDKAIQNIVFTPARLLFASDNIEQMVLPGQTLGKDHWKNRLGQTCSKTGHFNFLTNPGPSVFLEMGPESLLKKLPKNMDNTTLHIPSLATGQEDWDIILKTLSRLYTFGVPIDWKGFDRNYKRKRLVLPGYPFQRNRFWINQKKATLDADRTSQNTQETTDKPFGESMQGPLLSVKKQLNLILTDFLSAPPPQGDVSLLDMGVNSLALIGLNQRLRKAFGVNIKIRQFFNQLKNIDALTAYIEKHCDKGRSGKLPTHSYPGQLSPDSTGTNSCPTEPKTPSVFSGKAGSIREASQSIKQKDYLNTFIKRYINRTAKSKQMVEKHRKVLADSRASVGFRFSTKEILYPIIAQRSQGAKIWDIDGNEYIDVTIGFGVHMFGHNPRFIVKAMEESLANQNLQVGPRSDLVGKVAQGISELTGMERITFCNSGTEAVMTAMRLARAATGRDKIAIFTGGYHGHSDGTVAFGDVVDGIPRTAPGAAGVTTNSVTDLIVLDYDTPESLEILKNHKKELAAIMVEPVQSRRPDVQPKKFLQALKKLSCESGCALIFDEMITGFRIHPGGAQAWFDVKADIATYGKVIGGGMPIGVIAGSRKYLDGIDGGNWQYGDDSYPETERTFFGGTFCQNPLTMATAHAAIKHLRKNSPKIQQRLNGLTAKLAEKLNHFFESKNVPITVVYFSSFFRFNSPLNLELFFYELLSRGLYIWEWRTCFLSTAHTQKDCDFIIKTVQKSVTALRRADFLVQALSQPVKMQYPQEKRFPLTDAQRQLWVLAQMSEQGLDAYNLNIGIRLQGPLNIPILEKAVQQIVSRHESLRTIIDPKGKKQTVLANLKFKIQTIDLKSLPERTRESEFKKQFSLANKGTFDLTQGSLARVHLYQFTEQNHVLALTTHHIISDGWSLGIIIQEIAETYSNNIEKNSDIQSRPMQFSEYIAWSREQNKEPEMREHEKYFLAKLNPHPPPLNLPIDHIRPARPSFRGSRATIKIPPTLYRRLVGLSRESESTLFMLLISVYTALLHRLTEQKKFVIGVTVANRPLEEFNGIIGYFAHIIPVISKVFPGIAFNEHLHKTKNELLDTYAHQDYPFASLIEKMNDSKTDTGKDSGDPPLIQAIFNLDRYLDIPEFNGLKTQLVSLPVRRTPFDISLNIIELSEELVIDCDYNSDLFDADTIKYFLEHYRTLLEAVLKNPREALDQLPLPGEKKRRKIPAQLNHHFFSRLPEPKVSALDYQAPLTETEKQLAIIWTKGLALKTIDRNGHFFRLGGHSLIGASVINEINEFFQLNLSLICLFDRPQLKDLAQYMDTLLWARKSIHPEPAQPTSDPMESSQEKSNLSDKNQDEIIL